MLNLKKLLVTKLFCIGATVSSVTAFAGGFTSGGGTNIPYPKDAMPAFSYDCQIDVNNYSSDGRLGLNYTSNWFSINESRKLTNASDLKWTLTARDLETGRVKTINETENDPFIKSGGITFVPNYVYDVEARKSVWTDAFQVSFTWQHFYFDENRKVQSVSIESEAKAKYSEDEISGSVSAGPIKATHVSFNCIKP